jgi:hypothetical protein
MYLVKLGNQLHQTEPVSVVQPPASIAHHVVSPHHAVEVSNGAPCCWCCLFVIKSATIAKPLPVAV